MPGLNDRVKMALDENRILVLGAQVLIGFQLRAVFETGFEAQRAWVQRLHLGATAAMLVAFTLLLFPGACGRNASGSVMSMKQSESAGAVRPCSHSGVQMLIMGQLPS